MTFSLIDKKLINTEHDYVALHEGKKQQIHQTFRPKSLSVDNKKRYGKQHKYKTCLYKQVDPFSVSCHWPQLMFCESSIAICLLFCLQLITCSVVLFISICGPVTKLNCVCFKVSCSVSSHICLLQSCGFIFV